MSIHQQFGTAMFKTMTGCSDRILDGRKHAKYKNTNQGLCDYLQEHLLVSFRAGQSKVSQGKLMTGFRAQATANGLSEVEAFL